MIQRTLANGLQVVLVEDHWHPLVALAVGYRADSRYDPPGKQGLAHLLEHLTFRSLGFPHTENVIPSARAGRASATTAHDTTCHSSQLLRPELEHALVIEAARMARLRVNGEDLAHERTIVAKECSQLVEGDVHAVAKYAPALAQGKLPQWDSPQSGREEKK
jgi:zinc protease